VNEGVGLWGSLIPLIIGSALVPMQIIITILLIGAPHGRSIAVAWVAGMTAVRLAQGLVFGLIVGSSAPGAEGSEQPGTIASVVLLVVAITFFVAAFKQLVDAPDEDAPPPRWMAMIDAVGPGRAFLFGAGIVVLGVKFWVFTLGAIAAIDDAGLGAVGSTAAFVVFVVLAESVHLVLIGTAFVAPERAASVLDRIKAWLTAHNRELVIVLGAVFGTWFLVKALTGLGLL
jgi:hypothetical protein